MGWILLLPYFSPVEYSIWHTEGKKRMSQIVLFQMGFAIQLAELAWGSTFEGKVMVGNSPSSCQNGMLNGNFSSIWPFLCNETVSQLKKGRKNILLLAGYQSMYVIFLREWRHPVPGFFWLNSHLSCSGSCSYKFSPLQFRSEIIWSSSMLTSLIQTWFFSFLEAYHALIFKDYLPDY